MKRYARGGDATADGTISGSPVVRVTTALPEMVYKAAVVPPVVPPVVPLWPSRAVTIATTEMRAAREAAVSRRVEMSGDPPAIPALQRKPRSRVPGSRQIP